MKRHVLGLQDVQEDERERKKTRKLDHRQQSTRICLPSCSGYELTHRHQHGSRHRVSLVEVAQHTRHTNTGRERERERERESKREREREKVNCEEKDKGRGRKREG